MSPRSKSSLLASLSNWSWPRLILDMSLQNYSLIQSRALLLAVFGISTINCMLLISLLSATAKLSLNSVQIELAQGQIVAPNTRDSEKHPASWRNYPISKVRWALYFPWFLSLLDLSSRTLVLWFSIGGLHTFLQIEMSARFGRRFLFHLQSRISSQTGREFKASFFPDTSIRQCWTHRL